MNKLGTLSGYREAIFAAIIEPIECPEQITGPSIESINSFPSSTKISQDFNCL